MAHIHQLVTQLVRNRQPVDWVVLCERDDAAYPVWYGVGIGVRWEGKTGRVHHFWGPVSPAVEILIVRHVNILHRDQIDGTTVFRRRFDNGLKSLQRSIRHFCRMDGALYIHVAIATRRQVGLPLRSVDGQVPRVDRPCFDPKKIQLDTCRLKDLFGVPKLFHQSTQR